MNDEVKRLEEIALKERPQKIQGDPEQRYIFCGLQVKAKPGATKSFLHLFALDGQYIGLLEDRHAFYPTRLQRKFHIRKVEFWEIDENGERQESQWQRRARAERERRAAARKIQKSSKT